MPRLPPGALRERLLRCTTAIIRERGLGFVSLRAVARRARVSHGAPAHHFRNKAGLLTAYAAWGYRRLSEQMAVATDRAGPDARDRLAAVGESYVCFARENPEQFGIMFRTELTNERDGELTLARDLAYGILGGAAVQCATQGFVAASELERVAISGWAIAHGLAVLWLNERLQARVGARDPAEVSRDVIELVVRRLMPGPARRRRR